jgi:site-specific DNA-cytosine methylase
MLRTLDLFSGVGGITYALQGLARPVAYCDWAKPPRDALASLMRRKLLPTAPICNDVRQLTSRWLTDAHGGNAEVSVDMIVGGFPCVGFSVIGHRLAFDNEESGLFSEILRLADDTRCPLLFLENVPNVLRLGMDHVVGELVTKRGFELRWTVVSAGMMGAPHKRDRWFCLAVRPGYSHTWSGASAFDPYPWGKMREPKRCVKAHDGIGAETLRKGMLGNSVVPDAVRYAFIYLVSRCSVVPTTLHTPRRWSLVPTDKTRQHVKNKKRRGVLLLSLPKTGIATVDLVIATVAALQPFRPQLRKKLVIDPQAFKSAAKPNPRMQTELVTEPLVRYTWSTPRHAHLYAANYLTARCIGDLETQIRFERSTPDATRGGYTNVQFVEYLMGYPLGWTAMS